MPFYYINVLIDINIKSAAPKKWDFCPSMSPNLFPTMKPNPDIIAVIIPISTVYTKTLWKEVLNMLNQPRVHLNL